MQVLLQLLMVMTRNCSNNSSTDAIVQSSCALPPALAAQLLHMLLVCMALPALCASHLHVMYCRAQSIPHRRHIWVSEGAKKSTKLATQAGQLALRAKLGLNWPRMAKVS